MKTSTQVYRELKAAQFSEPRAKALVEILQAGGIVEHEPPQSELDRIEQYLLAEPFQPFVIEMSTGASDRIERRGQCGFTRQGSVQLSEVDDDPRFGSYHPGPEDIGILGRGICEMI